MTRYGKYSICLNVMNNIPGYCNNSISMDTKSKIKIILVTVLILNCIGVVLVWPVDIASGAYIGGLFSGEDLPTIPIFRLLADYMMAALTMTGLIGWLQHRAWGKSVALFGLGMFCYYSVNSLGWAILNNPILALPMVFTIVLTVIALPFLFEKEIPLIQPSS
jgi:hypothetical protein